MFALTLVIKEVSQMLQLVDQNTDLGGHEWHRITQLYAIPDNVKTAGLEHIQGGADVQDHMFADPVSRKFPCHTASATIASAAYLYEKAGHLVDRPEVAQIESRIVSSADFFNVGQDVSQLKATIKKAHTFDEKELSDDSFALVIDNGSDRERTRKYPMRNALEVKRAAEYLIAHRDEFTYDDRHTIACKIIEKRAEFGAGLGDLTNIIEKQAGMGTCPGSRVVELLQTRIDSLNYNGKQGEYREALGALCEKIAGDPANVHDPATLHKIAGVVDNIDRECRFNNSYGVMLDRPEDVLFQLTEKIASDVTSELVGSSMTGNFFKRSELAAVPLESLRAVMGDEFASAISTGNAWVDVEKMAAIVPTLPLGDMQQLESALFEQSVYPIATKTAQAGVGLPVEAVQQAARAENSDPGSLWSKI
jgi:hypothetical protein